jgi:pSer/pThr/pTyr-binding forkhead associated (FHA) protein
LARHPLERHASTPEELRDRLAAERRGTPFVVYRDADERQRIVELAGTTTRLTIGRHERNDIALGWDGEVSRLHAVLELVGFDWVLSDDRLSRNGTYVNGERVSSRALRSGDLIAVGDTQLAFVAPDSSSGSVTLTAAGVRRVADVTPGQRRVLVALCRPVLDHRPPASNREIASELVVAIDTVKGVLSRLFELFDIAREVPQNQKRALLAQRALQAGAVRPEDFAQ